VLQLREAVARTRFPLRQDRPVIRGRDLPLRRSAMDLATRPSPPEWNAVLARPRQSAAAVQRSGMPGASRDLDLHDLVPSFRHSEPGAKPSVDDLLARVVWNREDGQALCSSQSNVSQT